MRIPSLVSLFAIAADMLLYILGAAFVGLVGLQVAHHIETGGKLFFQPPEGCVRLSNGALECIVANATSSVPLKGQAQDGLLAAQHDEKKDDPGTRADQETIRQESQSEQVSSNGDDGPSGSPSDRTNPAPADATTTTKQQPPFETITAQDIHDAAHTGNAQRLQEYLHLKPKFVDVADHNRWNALHLAARAGNTQIVHILLKAGANPRLRTMTGKTAWEIAKERLEPDHPIVQLLKGPVLIMANGELVTAEQFRDAADRGLADVIQQYLSTAATNNDNDILDHGDVNGWNALHMAARSGHAQVVKLLVDAGANPTLKTGNQKTALTIATEKHGNDSEIVDILRSVLVDEL